MVTQVPAAEAQLEMAQDGQPTLVLHRDGKQVWFADQLMCAHRVAAGNGAGAGDWLRLRVWGPLPGEPGARGMFIMVAEQTGQWPWWQIRPANGPCERCGLTHRTHLTSHYHGYAAMSPGGWCG
jgi:hypothetical protein